MIFVGDDWSEAHHDVCLMDEAGTKLAARRLPEGLAGVAVLHEMVAEHTSDAGEVVVGIETDRGLWVAALVGAGYQVYAITRRVNAVLSRMMRLTWPDVRGCVGSMKNQG